MDADNVVDHAPGLIFSTQRCSKFHARRWHPGLHFPNVSDAHLCDACPHVCILHSLAAALAEVLRANRFHYPDGMNRTPASIDDVFRSRVPFSDLFVKASSLQTLNMVILGPYHEG